MKKALEAAVVAVALALGAFVARQVVARRQAAARAARPVNPALAPGTDAEDPSAAPAVRRRDNTDRSVDRLPMIKLSRPPKPVRGTGVVPEPPAP